MKTKAAANIDEYIAGFPKEVQEILEKIRRTIAKVVKLLIRERGRS